MGKPGNAGYINANTKISERTVGLKNFFVFLAWVFMTSVFELLNLFRLTVDKTMAQTQSVRPCL